MTGQPLELTLELSPAARLDLIDVRRRAIQESDGLFRRYARALYCSYHTTAGFVDDALASRLQHDRSALDRLFSLFGHLFPPDAGYRHDSMEERRELSEAQRRVEPRNADSHLTYIGSGLHNCVTCDNHQERPVYFVDLDGKNGSWQRTRKATVMGFSGEREVACQRLDVPVSHHQVDSVNLKDESSGFAEQLAEFVARQGVDRGQLAISLAAEEEGAGLTVNEYETLLMHYDLVEVLRNPLHFAADVSRNALADLSAVPAKAWNYAKYDFIQVVNELIDLLGLSETVVERWVARAAAIPASRMLRTKRTVSLLVTRDEATGRSQIVQGRYQTPILFQWRGSARHARTLDVTLSSFQ